jgi:hypothetical protein
MSGMTWRLLGRVAGMTLAVAEMVLAACAPVASEEAKAPPQAAPHESAKSSPPDLTPYARPLIPEDTMIPGSVQPPAPRSGGSGAPVPGIGGRAPEPGPSREAAPQPGQGPAPPLPTPQPTVR